MEYVQFLPVSIVHAYTEGISLCLMTPWYVDFFFDLVERLEIALSK